MKKHICGFFLFIFLITSLSCKENTYSFQLSLPKNQEISLPNKWNSYSYAKVGGFTALYLPVGITGSLGLRYRFSNPSFGYGFSLNGTIAYLYPGMGMGVSGDMELLYYWGVTKMAYSGIEAGVSYLYIDHGADFWIPCNIILFGKEFCKASGNKNFFQIGLRCVGLSFDGMASVGCCSQHVTVFPFFPWGVFFEYGWAF